MRGKVLQIAIVTLAFVTFAVSTADAEEKGWSIRLNGTWTMPNDDVVDNSQPEVQYETITGETFGLALSGEYRFSDRAGLEIGVQAGYESSIKYNVREKQTGGIVGDPLDSYAGDKLRFTIFDAALNIYLTSGEGVDLYVGPVLGVVGFEDTTVRLGSEDPPIVIMNDGQFAYGAVIGLDIPFVDSPWFVTSSIKYLVTSYDAKGPIAPTQEIDFDPFIFRLGLGYRF